MSRAQDPVIGLLGQPRGMRLVQSTTSKGTPRCIWCGKPIPNAYQRYYRRAGQPRFFHSDYCGKRYGQWVAVQLYIPAKDERVDERRQRNNKQQLSKEDR